MVSALLQRPRAMAVTAFVAFVGCVPAIDGSKHAVEKPRPGPAEDLGAVIDDTDAVALAEKAESSWKRVCEKTRPRDRAAIDAHAAACASGVMKECMHLGRVNMCGAGIDRNPHAALPLFDIACKSNDADACHMQANALLAGASGQREPAAGLRVYATACEAGSARLCGIVGSMLTALGKARSMPRGRDYLEKACKGGEHDACADLTLSALSRSGPREPDRAIAAATRGCAADHADSCAALGAALLMTNGDRARAVALLDGACAKGSSLGCSFLGFCYHHGLGVAQDHESAVRVLHKACNSSSPAGCRLLAKVTSGAPPRSADPEDLLPTVQ